MLRWILVLLLIPFVDAVLLAVIVSQTDVIGWVGMVLLVVLTGLVGMLLVRAEGRRTLRSMQRSLSQGDPPTNQLLDGAFLIAAGAFLLTPGLVTDGIGLLFVIPLTRMPIRAALKRFVIVPYLDAKTGGFASGTVWTFGFPQDGSAANGAGTNSGTGGRSSHTTWTSSGSNRGSTGGSTVDLADDAYTVDKSDVRTGRDNTTESTDADEYGSDTSLREDTDDDGHAR